MDGYRAAMALLPVPIRAAAEKLSETECAVAAEFRLRRGWPPAVLLPSGEQPLGSMPIEAGDLQRVLENACHCSPYTVRDSMAQGYIIASGGVRLGLCGRMNPTETGEYVMAEISSLSIRIPRQVIGCADGLTDKHFVSTLIVSPPGCGKTTLLRDMIRIVSNRGTRIGLCDERGEVAAISHGQAGFDVGRCTDVMTGLPKAQAAMAILRSMNPQVLAMDEITAPEDVVSCTAAANCGVQLLATAHARTKEELYARPVYHPLADWKIFQRLITISIQDGRRIYREELP